MKEKDIVHICVIADSGYAVPTAVMLTSAKVNKHIESKYVIHYLSNGLSDFDKRKVMELSSPDFRVEIQECNADKYKDIKVYSDATFTISAMIKCELGELLPSVDKVLMLDGDIIVKGDLTALYEEDISDVLIAMVKDLGASQATIGCVQEVEHYCNVGVMLMNLDVMRREHTGEQFIQTKLAAPDSWIWVEQDPINWVCRNRLRLLHLKWNAMVSVFRTQQWPMTAINSFYNTNYSTMRELEDDAVILHFAAFNKPWKNRLYPYFCVYQKYYNLSPYSNTELEHIVDSEPVVINEVSNIKIKLFSCLPFLLIKDKPHRKDCYMLGFIRLFKLRKTGRKRQLLLFGFLPVLSWKTYF